MVRSFPHSVFCVFDSTTVDDQIFYTSLSLCVYFDAGCEACRCACLCVARPLVSSRCLEVNMALWALCKWWVHETNGGEPGRTERVHTACLCLSWLVEGTFLAGSQCVSLCLLQLVFVSLLMPINSHYTDAVLPSCFLASAGPGQMAFGRPLSLARCWIGHHNRYYTGKVLTNLIKYVEMVMS